MNKFLIIRVFHFIYLGLLLIFIGFYFLEYKPYKLQTACAEKSAKEVVKLNPQHAYELYQQFFKTCLSHR